MLKTKNTRSRETVGPTRSRRLLDNANKLKTTYSQTRGNNDTPERRVYSQFHVARKRRVFGCSSLDLLRRTAARRRLPYPRVIKCVSNVPARIAQHDSPARNATSPRGGDTVVRFFATSVAAVLRSRLSPQKRDDRTPQKYRISPDADVYGRHTWREFTGHREPKSFPRANSSCSRCSRAVRVVGGPPRRDFRKTYLKT